MKEKEIILGDYKFELRYAPEYYHGNLITVFNVFIMVKHNRVVVFVNYIIGLFLYDEPVATVGFLNDMIIDIRTTDTDLIMLLLLKYQPRPGFKIYPPK